MMLTSEDVLFVGKGKGVVSWYRTGMPSFTLGCDWAAVSMSPPNLIPESSLKRGGHGLPDFDKYKIIILQQVAGRDWHREIVRLRKKGICVIYEVDDYLHGVRKVKGHRAAAHYSRKNLALYELCMRACDAMICSTEWLAQTYRKFNPNVFVCPNGIEAARYSKYQLPERETINIGWAGGEGHLDSARTWIPAVNQILDEYPETRFVSLGLPIANLLKRPDRAVALPFVGIENFAGALTNFDIALGPAGRGSFFKAKSDLRFLETGGLGIPLIGDPFVYDDIRDVETGLIAKNGDDAYMCMRLLLDNPEARFEIGAAARDYVLNRRSIEVAVQAWERVFMWCANS
jgi:glycosyltransferase involved in cell wall biosynthesis